MSDIGNLMTVLSQYQGWNECHTVYLWWKTLQQFKIRRKCCAQNSCFVLWFACNSKHSCQDFDVMAKRLGERVDRSCRIRVSLHEVFPDFIRCYFKSRL